MLGIVRGEQGWHTYTLRKASPLRPRAGIDMNALTQSWTRLYHAAGKAWRRVRPRAMRHRQDSQGLE